MKIGYVTVTLFLAAYSAGEAATLGNSTSPSYSGENSSIFLDPEFGFASMLGTLEEFSPDATPEAVFTDYDITGTYDATLGLTDASLTIFETVTSVTDGLDIFLTGELSDATSFGGTTWELLFDVTGGEAASLYGSSALVVLSSVISDIDPFTGEIFGTADVAISAVAQKQVVPLPASLPLLAVAIGGIAGISRRRQVGKHYR